MIRLVALTREWFDEALESNGGDASVEYLWDYLAELGAKTVLVEDDYIDRHFLDEFSHYYARAFQVPSARCQRFHFFAGDGEIDELLNAAMTGDRSTRRDQQRKLNEKYLGFVVRRPLRNAPLGRTVLKTYPPDGGRRHYTAVRTYRVHVMGLTLKVDGLAYQQQDGGAAVCASTALWSALQNIAKTAGHRTPTPFEVTTASGSPFAASFGLDDRQMAVALSKLGYAADYLTPAENRARFRATLGVSLRSRLPVILLVSRTEETGAGKIRVGHAIAVTGFALDDTSRPIAVPMAYGLPPVPMIEAAIETIYAHDDNLGSHAHYELFDWDDEKSDSGHLALGLLRGRSAGPHKAWWTPDEWRVDAALIPKPPKLRMPIENLFDFVSSFSAQLFPLLFPQVPLHFGARITTGIEYREDVLNQGLSPAQMREFQERLSLPRFVGLITARIAEHTLCEFAVDVTAIDRQCDAESILGVIAPRVELHSAMWKRLDAFSKAFKIPLITAPASTP